MVTSIAFATSFIGTAIEIAIAGFFGFRWSGGAVVTMTILAPILGKVQGLRVVHPAARGFGARHGPALAQQQSPLLSIIATTTTIIIIIIVVVVVVVVVVVIVIIAIIGQRFDFGRRRGAAEGDPAAAASIVGITGARSGSGVGGDGGVLPLPLGAATRLGSPRRRR